MLLFTIDMFPCIFHQHHKAEVVGMHSTGRDMDLNSFLGCTVYSTANEPSYFQVVLRCRGRDRLRLHSGDTCDPLRPVEW